MATFLDITLLQYFSIIFPLILVFAIIFAFLEITKVLGENKGLNSLVAVVIAIITISSTNILKVINWTTPWFVLLIFFIYMLYFIFKFMGVTDQKFSEVIVVDRAVYWTVIVIAIIILFAGLGTVYGPSLVPSGEPQPQVTKDGVPATGAAGTTFEANIYNTFFNPKILGMMLVLAIAVFAILLLTRELGP
ncbi:MAG: hypothetical protein QW331_00210 [Candidatus Woesearchaeota archaeon]